MLDFLTENNLISPNESGFRPGDSCINYLLLLKTKIVWWWFQNKEIFLDILKSFDKVWHEDLLLKLSWNSISGKLLKLLSDFLCCRKQLVVLIGQHSSWENVNARVPQGSVLRPLLFLIYKSNLFKLTVFNVRTFCQ